MMNGGDSVAGRKAVDRTWQQYGRLTVTSRAERKGMHAFWNCVCECGNTSVVDSDSLQSGSTVSCGCYAREATAARGKTQNLTHGMSKTSEYIIWIGMQQRCNNSKHESYEYYGGRGVKVLFKSFEEFLECVGPRPSLEYSVDRIDNDGNYELGNVKWSTYEEQTANQRPLYLRRLHTDKGKRGPRRDVKPSSRYIGVCKTQGKWKVNFQVNKKRQSLGYFPLDQEEAAAMAYDRAALSHHGDRAVLNFEYLRNTYLDIRAVA